MELGLEKTVSVYIRKSRLRETPAKALKFWKSRQKDYEEYMAFIA